MSTYAIGDIQGCYASLQGLLEYIAFNPEKDTLWFAGDLVNRGHQSLAVLRFIKSLAKGVVVLGNHDLHLLAIANGYGLGAHTLQDILNAPDKEELLNWLRTQPLFHYDATLNCGMVHAGLLPQWSRLQAQAYANEVAVLLKQPDYALHLPLLYGDQPNRWKEELTGWDRLRCLLNVFTRMRFCTPQGQLDFTADGKIGSQPTGYLPWFEMPTRMTADMDLVFGHWSALQGEVNGVPRVFALDTGCVWNGFLTALRLEDKLRFSVPCQ